MTAPFSRNEKANISIMMSQQKMLNLHPSAINLGPKDTVDQIPLNKLYLIIPIIYHSTSLVILRMKWSRKHHIGTYTMFQLRQASKHCPSLLYCNFLIAILIDKPFDYSELFNKTHPSNS